MSIQSRTLRVIIGHILPLIAVFTFARPAFAQDAPLAPVAPVEPAGAAPSPLLGDVRALSTGGYHTCVLTYGGSVLCWGSDQHGQLGDGSRPDGTGLEDQVAPVDVLGFLAGAKAVAAGFRHTCALTALGGVKCWGNDEYGQVGDGNGASIEPIGAPVQVVGLESGVLAITAGNSHSCALMQTGGVKCWGSDERGQLGNGGSNDSGDNPNHATPVDVVGLPAAVKEIAAGGFHTCALLQTGAVACWGGDSNGQVGDGGVIEPNGKVQTPVVLGSMPGALHISTGFGHTCAVTSGQSAMCWGWNAMGQLGNGSVVGERSSPTAVVDLTNNIEAINAGFYHSCAIKVGGMAVCWGANDEGQVGNDRPRDEEPRPMDVIDLGAAAQIAGGSSHTCAVTTTGRVKCWGADGNGQLGDGGKNEEKLKPVDVRAAIPRLMLPIVMRPQ